MENQIALRPYDIGCEPSPSVPAEVLMQDGWNTFLLFYATSKDVSPSTGYLEDLGVAVVECVQCVSTRSGYPNDEGIEEHPLWNAGLGNCEEDVIEVLNSPWNQEVEVQRSASYNRILGKWPNFSQRPESKTRHFPVLLKEVTFECLADEMKVVLFAKDYDEAFAYVIGRMKNTKTPVSSAWGRRPDVLLRTATALRLHCLASQLQFGPASSRRLSATGFSWWIEWRNLDCFSLLQQASRLAAAADRSRLKPAE